jgi:threonine-phosphate decarboxylase
MRDQGRTRGGRIAFGFERKRVAVSQAFHGGRLLDAEREFGLTRDQFIDFSSNLNVFAPSISAVEWECWASQIGRYPEADSEMLRRRLAEFYRISGDWILPTSGASEALYLAARLFTGRKAAIVEPGFSDYSRSFETVDCECTHVILTQPMWFEPVEKWAHYLEPFDVVVLGNPNNPTGSLQRRADFARLFEDTGRRPKSWIVDEAFMEFIDEHENETLLSVIEKFPSLIVVRSLTKSWRIPGLRLGFLATAGPMDRLRRMQPPWCVNSLVEAWSKTFLADERRAQLADSLESLRIEKRRFVKQLSEVPGIRLHCGTVNFLLVELISELLEAGNLYEELGRRGLLVRVCDSFRGLARGRFMRLAVRTAIENDRLVRELSALCEQKIRRVA